MYVKAERNQNKVGRKYQSKKRSILKGNVCYLKDFYVCVCAGNSWNILKLKKKYIPGMNFQCRSQLRVTRNLGVEMRRMGTNNICFKFEKCKA